MRRSACTSLAFRRFALDKSERRRSTSPSSASNRLAFLKRAALQIAVERSARKRVAPSKFAPLRSAGLGLHREVRSGKIHHFQPAILEIRSHEIRPAKPRHLADLKRDSTSSDTSSRQKTACRRSGTLLRSGQFSGIVASTHSTSRPLA